MSTDVEGLTTPIVYPSTGVIWGVVRSMWNWVTLSGYNLLSLGSNLKYYIQNSKDGNFFDVTPIRDTATAVATAFTTNTATNTATTTTHTPPHPSHIDCTSYKTTPFHAASPPAHANVTLFPCTPQQQQTSHFSPAHHCSTHAARAPSPRSAAPALLSSISPETTRDASTHHHCIIIAS